MRYAIVAILGALTASAAAESLTVVSAADTTIYANDDTLSNGAGGGFVAGTTGGGGLVRRGLIAFGLGGVPSGAIVTSVTLDLFMDRTNISAPTPSNISLHRVTRGWGEGTSATESTGIGTAATIGDATWSHAVYDGAAWTTPGGDFVASASATTLTNDVGPYGWSGALLAADLQRWLADPASNHGWILIGDEATSGTGKRFVSHESATAEQRPRLTIQYVVPQPGDMNCDGAFNNFDIDPFVLALISPSDYALQFPNCDLQLGNINGDEAFNNFDIDPFVNCIVNGC